VGRPGFGNDDELTVVRSRVLPGDVNAVLLLNDATTVNFRGHDSCPTRQRTSQRGEGRDSPGLTPVSARARSVPDYTVSSALLHVNRNLEGSMRGAKRVLSAHVDGRRLPGVGLGTDSSGGERHVLSTPCSFHTASARRSNGHNISPRHRSFAEIMPWA
jgi:hypothetical protein